MFKLGLIVVTLVLCGCGKGVAANLDIKGVKIGDPFNEQAVKSAFVADEDSALLFCIPTSAGCTGETYVGPIPVSFIISYDDNNKIEYILLIFDPDSFDTVVPIFIKKYGHATKDETKSNQLGQNRILTWIQGDLSLELDKYNAKGNAVAYLAKLGPEHNGSL